jgi:hypothetical protein
VSDDLTFICSGCGERHGLPFDYHMDSPVYWASLSWWDRRKSHLDSDLCVIKNEHFFMKGLIYIPVIGREEIFHWGVWVSLSDENFKRAIEVYEQPGRENEPPYFGWLSNDLVPHYPSTLNLKANLHTQPVGQRPLIELEPIDHPLAVEQRQGITMARVEELGRAILHGS